MPANTVPFDPRTYTISVVARAIEDSLLRSQRPLSEYELRYLLSEVPTKPGFTKEMLGRLGIFERERMLSDPEIQKGFKRALWDQWVITTHDPKAADQIFIALRSFFYPMAGTESYLLRHPYVFVKVQCLAGGMTVYFGPKGSGKSDLFTLHVATLANLKQQHMDEGPRSDLALFNRVGRFFRPLDEPSQTEIDRQPTPPDPEPIEEERLLEPVGGTFKRPKKMNLYSATDIRFPTNVSIDRKSVVGDRVQFGGRVSDIVLDCLKNDENGIHSNIGLDEFGAGAGNRRNASSKGAMVVNEFVSTHRKWWSSLSVLAQYLKQLNEDLTNMAQAHFEKLSLENQDEALITIDGLFRQQRFRDVPKSPVNFDSQSNASFFPDISLVTTWDWVSEKQREFLETDEGEWNHLMEIKEARWFIEKYRATTSDIAGGRNGVLRSTIRTLLDKQDANTHEKYTHERIARIIADDTEQDWHEVLKTVQEVAGQVDKERKAKARGERKTSAQIEAEYAALRDTNDVEQKGADAFR